MREILLDHQRRYPRWNEEDLYKLIHQSAMGNEHAIQDEAAVRRWMERELDALGQGPSEPLLDPISPDGQILRVHLRPMLRSGLSVDELLQAFINSPQLFKGSRTVLEESMRTALDLAAAGEFGISSAHLQTFFDEMRAADLPAVHHSRFFEESYHPAYRVVVRQALPAAFMAS